MGITESVEVAVGLGNTEGRGTTVSVTIDEGSGMTESGTGVIVATGVKLVSARVPSFPGSSD